MSNFIVRNGKFLNRNKRFIVNDGGMPPPPPSEIIYRTDEYNDIEDIWKQILPTDKIIMLVRHSERNGEDITQQGIEWAKATGRKIKGIFSPEEVHYGSTNVDRCKITAQCIAEGRNDGTIESDTSVDGPINGNAFCNNPSSSLYTNTWILMSKYAYDYDLLSSGEKAIMNDEKTVIDNAMEALKENLGNKKLGIYVSHDHFMVPFVAYNTNKELKMEFWKTNRWIYYITGMMIVFRNEKQNYIPIWTITRESGQDGYHGIKIGY